MKILEKILLAIDFSKSSDNLMKNAIEFSKVFDSKIILIHVLPKDIKSEKVKRLVEEAAISKLKGMEGLIQQAGVKTETPVLEYGTSFDKIIETSERMDANLIFISAGDKAKDTAYQLGSTAENIVRNSTKPVWVDKQGASSGVNSIICPVDFSKESERALKNAIILARRIKAKLVVLTVYELVYTGTIHLDIDWKTYNEQTRSDHLRKFDSFLSKFNLADLDWERIIESGKPSTQILVAVKRFKSDLLIMGTSGRTGLTRMILGSVTEKVIREVPCSFVTLKTEDVIDLKLEYRMRDIESAYKDAVQLMNDGFLQESILEFKRCLHVNDMHSPSLKGLSKVYELLGNTHESEVYRVRAEDVYNRIWDLKIEAEIRRSYKV